MPKLPVVEPNPSFWTIWKLIVFYIVLHRFRVYVDATNNHHRSLRNLQVIGARTTPKRVNRSNEAATATGQTWPPGRRKPPRFLDLWRLMEVDTENGI